VKDIERTPRRRWERIGFWLMVLPLLPVLVLSDVLEELGLSWWERNTALLLLTGLAFHLLSKPIAAERSARLASDLELGVFDCAIRFPGSRPGSLGDVWEPGAGQRKDTTLYFQSRMADEQGSAAGRLKTFHNAVTTTAPADPPTRRPPGWRRDWQVVHLSTENGLLQVAASKASCDFIAGAFAA
jgi:hypothetical protein